LTGDIRKVDGRRKEQHLYQPFFHYWVYRAHRLPGIAVFIQVWEDLSVANAIYRNIALRMWIGV
jgi:hypothetical protein